MALPRIARFLEDARTWARISPEGFQRLATGIVTRVSAAAGALSGKLLMGVFDAMLTVVLVIFLRFFMFRDGERMAEAAVDLLPIDTDGRSHMSQSLQSTLAAIFLFLWGFVVTVLLVDAVLRPMLVQGAGREASFRPTSARSTVSSLPSASSSVPCSESHARMASSPEPLAGGRGYSPPWACPGALAIDTSQRPCSTRP